MRSKRIPPQAKLKDLCYPHARFWKEAVKLHAKAPAVDIETVALFMTKFGDEYVRYLEYHDEGSDWQIKLAVFKVAASAKLLLGDMSRLGPAGRNLVLGENSEWGDFMGGAAGRWLVYLAKLHEEMEPEILDTPFEGRPPGTTKHQRGARYRLLYMCAKFWEPMLENGYSDDQVSRLTLEMARGIHRVLVDPSLPSKSQLFRKEWEDRLVQ